MEVGVSGYLFLALAGIAVPWLAVRTSARVAAGVPLPPRWVVYLESAGVLTALGTAALATAARHGIELFPPPSFAKRDALLAAGALGIGLATMPWRWARRPWQQKRRLYSLVPSTRPETALWLLVCLSAGLWEEIAYRGVMFALLLRLSGEFWVAAAWCALAFAVAHRVQGRSTAAIIFFIAVGFHLLVRVTGSLYLVMAIHFLYDLAVGIWVGRAGRREFEPARAPISLSSSLLSTITPTL
jgi:membrane protease YdiL (CAAX protease family)